MARYEIRLQIGEALETITIDAASVAVEYDADNSECPAYLQFEDSEGNVAGVVPWQLVRYVARK